MRDQYGFDTTAVRSQQFFFQTTDWQHQTTQGDLTGHGDISSHRVTRQARNQRGTHRDTRTWTVFRCCPFWNVDVDVAFFVEVRVDT
ncbi:hypothetical protein D3C72_1230450 [compost metagenome]